VQLDRAETTRGDRTAVRRRQGLRGRILLWFLILSLLPLLVSNTVGYLVTRRIIEGQVERYVRALAELEAQHVEREVERHRFFLDAVVAGNTFLIRSVPEVAVMIQRGARQGQAATALHEHLDRKLAELPPLTELFVIDTGGTVIASTLHSRVGADWSDTDLFRRGSAARFLSHDLDAIGGLVAPGYRLATPIRDVDGTLVGVLAGSVGIERVHAFLQIPPQLAGDIHSFVVDSLGHPLFVSHPQAQIDYHEPLRSPLLDGPPGSVARYVNYEGTSVIGTSVAIPGGSWTYIAEVSRASALGQLRGLAILAAALEATFALLLVAVVWVVARSIVEPLRRLVTGAERIRSGELGVEVQIDRPDELGDLGRTFNQMSLDLDTSHRQIRELHDQEMRRAAQLASVGELASGIAHEIKNPIAGLESGIDLVARQVGADSKASTILGQMRTQLQRMESAIRDLLSYARPREPRRVVTEPEQLVDRVIALVHPQADAADVRIEKRVARGVGKIHIDPELVTQTLVNLVLNGIQAMEPRGTLEISTHAKDHQVCIAVTDTGTGIPREQFESIFRPFYTTKHRGSGLGLAISRGIVERHGGRLIVESAVGRGSTFTVVLPATPDEPVTP
jgi:signal transduction histidine kinase